jgi:hypothetical protein
MTKKKRIVITITHRNETINILSQYLSKQRSSFDEWHIWFNSQDQELKDNLNKLDAIIIEPGSSNPADKLDNLHFFYKEDSVDNNSNYLKLDDDIVWLEPNFVDKMFMCREANDINFLIYSNIINNAVLSNIHMRIGAIPWDAKCGYYFLDPTGWGNPLFAESIHNTFLSDIKTDSYNKWHFNQWNLDYKELVSINSICWRGEDLAIVAPTMINSDEFWLCNYGPSAVNKNSIIMGNSICAHYAFHTQKTYLDSTNILEQYKNLAFSV